MSAIRAKNGLIREFLVFTAVCTDFKFNETFLKAKNHHKIFVYVLIIFFCSSKQKELENDNNLIVTRKVEL